MPIPLLQSTAVHPLHSELGAVDRARMQIGTDQIKPPSKAAVVMIQPVSKYDPSS